MDLVVIIYLFFTCKVKRKVESDAGKTIEARLTRIFLGVISLANNTQVTVWDNETIYNGI